MTCLDQQKLLQYSMILTDLIDMNIRYLLLIISVKLL
jgi:hypothetical protein